MNDYFNPSEVLLHTKVHAVLPGHRIALYPEHFWSFEWRTLLYNLKNLGQMFS